MNSKRINDLCFPNKTKYDCANSQKTTQHKKEIVNKIVF